MNKTAIINLAQLLENIPEKHEIGFNMDFYMDDLEYAQATNVKHNCNTVACIAGWGSQFLRKDGKGILNRPRVVLNEEAYDVAREILDLCDYDAQELFEPMNNTHDGVDFSEVKPHEAAKVLRHLAETGEVDWDVAFA